MNWLRWCLARWARDCLRCDKAADRVELGCLVRERARVVLPVRIAGIGGLDEAETRRPSVHGDRPDGHVRPRGLVSRSSLEVQAEAGEALRGPVGEDDVVAGQELVRRGVVDEVHVAWTLV